MSLTPSTSIQHEDISAWVSIEDSACQVYSIEQPKPNTYLCWIASEPGKKFSVDWRNTSRKESLRSKVIIDGVIAREKHIIPDATSFPDVSNCSKLSYARTSEFTRRDFMFTIIEVTDDDAYMHTLNRADTFGSITLELWRVDIKKAGIGISKYHGNPVLESCIVHEKSKKAGLHHVMYGEEYHFPATPVQRVYTTAIEPAPYLSFTFRYRPIDVLMASGIVLPPPVIQQDLALKAEHTLEAEQALEVEQVLTEIRALEAKIETLRKKTQSIGGVAQSPLSALQHVRIKRERIKSEPGESGAGIQPKKRRGAPVEVIDLTDL